MVWVVVIVGIGVLGLAALAASGKLGAMPPPVNSRPVGRLPEGELSDEALASVRFRTTGAGNGYAPAQVDALLDRAVAGTLTTEELDALDLPICKDKGYAFDEVDHVVELLRHHLTEAHDADAGEVTGAHEATVVDAEASEAVTEELDADGDAADTLETLYAAAARRRPDAGADAAEDPATPRHSDDAADADRGSGSHPVSGAEGDPQPLSRPVVRAEDEKSAE